MAGSDRRPYESASTLSQTIINSAADNQTNSFELVVDIETPTGFIRASDRHKYVDGTFYRALTNFPEISRTIGEWLNNQVEFSTLSFELNNSDGRFNNFLSGGSDFNGWIGKSVTVRLGLREIGSSYFTIFRGFVTEVQGLTRSVQSIVIQSRDRFDRLNTQFPTATFTSDEFGVNLDRNVEGQAKPYILGDWTTDLQAAAVVPAFPINGDDPDVKDDGGLRNAVEFLVSSNALSFFDTDNVYIRSGTELFKFDVADVTLIADGNNNRFTVDQNGTSSIDGEPYLFSPGDELFVQVRGPSLGGFQDNILQQAREVLIAFGGAVLGDFTANWNTLRNKTTPTQSAIANIKSRIWVQDTHSAFEYAKGLVQQVRCEIFINRDLDIDIHANHYEDWDDTPDFEFRNFDVVRQTFTPALDDRNNFNTGRGVYSFEPIANENVFSTDFYENANAVTQAGKVIERSIVFPNLYVLSDVENQLTEILRLSSAYAEVISFSSTWRAILLDIGDFVSLDVRIGGVTLENVPGLVREISYNPDGLQLGIRVWSFQMFPFKTYNPGHAGITSGQSATITKIT